MKKAFFALMAAAALTLSSCGDPTFDKSNPEESLRNMGEDLNDEQKLEFAKATTKIIGQNLLNPNAAYEKMHGKTAEEIIEMANDSTVSLSSCSAPTFDKNNIKESYDAIMEKLSDKKKEEFSGAFASLCMQYGEFSRHVIFEKMHGKTAEEIIEMRGPITEK